MNMKTLWKFLHLQDGKIKSDRGDCSWTDAWKKHEGEVRCCSGGFHASIRAIDALRYVSGSVIAKVEVKGKSHIEKDKEAWESMRIIEARHWKKEDSVKLAIFCAEKVLPIYEKRYPKDDRVRKAIEAAKIYLADASEMNRFAAADAAARAADAAYAAYAANAAYAAYAAANAAANAANAAYAAANAANAAYAAARAADAAYAAADAAARAA